LYNWLLIIIPPPIPEPSVNKIKFFFLTPSLASAKAAQLASFSTSTFTLNLFLIACFKLKFLNGKFGGFFIIPSFRGPGDPIPIAFILLSPLASWIVEKICFRMKAFPLEEFVGFSIIFCISLPLNKAVLILVAPKSIAIIFFLILSHPFYLKY